MKAAVHTRYGPPSVVQIADVVTPTAADHQVLIKVHATTVNRTDSAYRAGKPFLARLAYGPLRPRVTILGNEFAGAVAAIGSGVTKFAVGDRVFGYNEGPFGAHAEYLVIGQDKSLATVPKDMTYGPIAPATEGSHHALSMIRAAKIRSGQRVLVYGATGGIGSAAVQLAKALGAEVTAVCGSQHLDLVSGLGADRVIDYQASDFTKDVDTYDVVLDAVGKSTFSACKRLLTPHGLYFSTELGPHSQNPFLALVTPLGRGRKVMFPIPKHNQEMVLQLKGLIESGKYTPVIDRHYPLNRIAEAYEYVDAGRKIGNVVIDVSPEP